MLLGEKKASPSNQLSKDNPNKEEIDNLYAQLNSLTCAENISGLVDRIHGNNYKYTDMAQWASKIEETTSFHADFLAELKEDELLLDKLEDNFKKNVGVVKVTIEQIRKEIKRWYYAKTAIIINYQSNSMTSALSGTTNTFRLDLSSREGGGKFFDFF